MNAPITFDRLAHSSNEDLERLLLQGTSPRMEDVASFDYRGYNLQCATVLIGTRKFKKGFYGDPQKGFLWGYNVPVIQNRDSDPWVAQPSDQAPKRYFFFGVLPAAELKHPNYKNSLVVVYSKWDGYGVADPVRYTVDYLVFPDPSNRKLMIGKSYAEVGEIRIFLGFFILEQYNPNDYQGPPSYPAGGA
jgi:hypothetical protein